MHIICPSSIFIKTLLKDLRYYFTLPKWTIRRLTKFDLTISKPNLVGFIEEINQIKMQLGAEYLDEMIKRVEDQKLEDITQR